MLNDIIFSTEEVHYFCEFLNMIVFVETMTQDKNFYLGQRHSFHINKIKCYLDLLFICYL